MIAVAVPGTRRSVLAPVPVPVPVSDETGETRTLIGGEGVWRDPVPSARGCGVDRLRKENQNQSAKGKGSTIRREDWVGGHRCGVYGRGVLSFPEFRGGGVAGGDEAGGPIDDR